MNITCTHQALEDAKIVSNEMWSHIKSDVKHGNPKGATWHGVEAVFKQAFDRTGEDMLDSHHFEAAMQLPYGAIPAVLSYLQL